MTSIGFTNEALRHEWAREHFRMNYGGLCTLVALGAAYETTGLPMLREAIDTLVYKYEQRGAVHPLLALEKMGYAMHGEPVGKATTWVITLRGAVHLLAFLTEEAKSGPGVVSVADVEELDLMEVG